MTRRKYDLVELAILLDSLLPTGFEDAILMDATIHHIADELGVPRGIARDVIQYHRRNFGTDSYAILQTSVGESHHVYWLSKDTAEIGAYLSGRLEGDLRERLITIKEICERDVRQTDGRTVEGKLARLRARQVTRLLEDVAGLAD